jgi:hypothetical protein
MGINEAAAAIEKFLLTYDGGSGRPVAVQVRLSGDDIDEIKVWVDLGGQKVDTDAWEAAAAAAIRDALPETHPFRLHLLAEGDPG